MENLAGGKVVWDLDLDDKNFNAKLDDAKREVEKTGKSISESLTTLSRNAGESMQKTGRSISEVGDALIKLGAAPTIALIGIAKAAIDFESSFAGIRKTVDLSEAGFQKLSANLRGIAKEAPVSVNELNRITELAGQLGVSGVDNLTKFTNVITKFTTATGIAGETAATSFARIANVMQEPIKNIDRMGSVVAQLGDSSAATEGEILQFSERIAGAGKIAGLSTANIFAIGSSMASVGVEAEAGGTAVQKVLISMYQAAQGSTSAVINNSKAIATNSNKLADMKKNLEVATQRQKEFGDKTAQSTKMANANQIEKYNREMGQLTGTLGALNATNGQAAISGSAFAKVLGVTNKEFETMFKKDPAKVFQDFVTKLGDVSEKGGDATKILADLELEDQRLIRAFLSLSNAGDLLSQQIKIANKEWETNSRLNLEAEKRYATTASQIQIAKNRLTDIGITLGAVVLPALNKLLLALAPVIDNFAKFAEKNPQVIVTVLAVGAAVGALGIGLVALGAVVTSVGVLIPVLGAALAFLVTPVGLVIAGVAALALGLAYLGVTTDLFKSKQDLLKASTDNLRISQEALKAAQGGLVDAHLRIQAATLVTERAQLNYNNAVKQYGIKSLEAREASLQLEQAKRSEEVATNDGAAALKKLEEQENKNIEVQKQHQGAIMKSESLWINLRDGIAGAIGKLLEWNDKALKMSNPFGGGKNIFGFANGVTNFSGGPAIVGEEGPEIVNLPRGADVFSNRESLDILSEMDRGGNSQEVNVTIGQMHVREEADVRKVARELGFRVETSSGFISNG